MEFIERAKRSSREAKQLIRKNTDIMKLNKKISEEDENKKNLFICIGQFYYEQITSGVVKPDESLQDLIIQIGDSDRRIEQYERKIEVLSMVRVCPRCHSEYGADSIFCGRCGTNLLEEEAVAGKRCFECGTELKAEDVFCYNCGLKVE